MLPHKCWAIKPGWQRTGRGYLVLAARYLPPNFEGRPDPSISQGSEITYARNLRCTISFGLPRCSKLPQNCGPRSRFFNAPDTSDPLAIMMAEFFWRQTRISFWFQPRSSDEDPQGSARFGGAATFSVGMSRTGRKLLIRPYLSPAKPRDENQNRCSDQRAEIQLQQHATTKHELEKSRWIRISMR